MFKTMIEIQNNIINSGFIDDIDIDNLNVSLNSNYSGEGRITFKGRDKVNNQTVELSIGISNDLLSKCGDSDEDAHIIHVCQDSIISTSINISKDNLARSYTVGDEKVYIYRISLPSTFDRFYYNLSPTNDRVLRENPYNLDIVSSNLYNEDHEVKLLTYAICIDEYKMY